MTWLGQHLQIFVVCSQRLAPRFVQPGLLVGQFLRRVLFSRRSQLCQCLPGELLLIGVARVACNLGKRLVAGDRFDLLRGASGIGGPVAAACRRPCAEHCGKPASRHCFLNQLVKLGPENGLPDAVVRNVRLVRGVAANACISLGRTLEASAHDEWRC